jgi:hypothetical protein
MEDQEMADENMHHASEVPDATVVSLPVASEETSKPDEAPAIVEPELPPEIQIVGINHTEPVISYKGNIFSCQWASSIGTDLLFTKRNVGTDSDREVLHSLDSWDLFAIGSGKLIASHAKLVPRRYEMPEAANTSFTAAPATPGVGISSMGLEEEEKVLQSDFLNRFAAIKAGKGEATEHTLSMLQGRTNGDGQELPPGRGRGRGRGSRGVRRARQPRAPTSSRPQGIEAARLNALQHLVPADSATSTPPSWGSMENSLYMGNTQLSTPPGVLFPPFSYTGGPSSTTAEGPTFPVFPDFSDPVDSPTQPSSSGQTLADVLRNTSSRG